jgi:hypothetical protein
MKALPSRSGVCCAAGVVLLLAGQRVEFLHLDDIKKFERATMTRIGRYQVRFPDSTGKRILPARQSRPAQILPTKLRRSISLCQRRLAALLKCISGRHLIHKLFFASPRW